jgi:hypothetical protein
MLAVASDLGRSGAGQCGNPSYHFDHGDRLAEHGRGLKYICIDGNPGYHKLHKTFFAQWLRGWIGGCCRSYINAEAASCWRFSAYPLRLCSLKNCATCLRKDRMNELIYLLPGGLQDFDSKRKGDPKSFVCICRSSSES